MKLHQAVLGWYQRSLSNQIALLSFSLVLLVMLGIGAISYVLGVRSIEANLDALMQRELSAGQEKIARAFSTANRELRLLAQNDLVLNSISDAVGRTAYIKPLISNHTLASVSASGLGLLDFQGQVIVASGEGFDLMSGPAQKTALHEVAMETLRTLQPKAVMYKDTDVEFAVLAYPLIYPASGLAEGVVLTLLDLPRLEAEVLPYVKGRKWQIMWPGAANVVASPRDSSVVLADGPLNLMSPLDRLGLRLSLADSRELAAEPRRDLMYQLLLLLLASLLAAFISSRTLGNYIARPLTRLASMADSVTSGGLRDIQIEIRSHDELGRLARAFSTMLGVIGKSQRGLEQEVKKRTRRLIQIHELSPDGIVEITSEQRIGLVNPAFERITGLLAHDLSGKSLDEFLRQLDSLQDLQHSSGRNSLSALLSKPMDNDAPLWVVQLGEPGRKVLAIGLYGEADQGQLVYMRDVSQEAQINRMKTDFLSTAAHELRTPLTSVVGFAELLQQKDYPKEKRDELLGVIRRHASSMTALVSDLLAIVRAEARVGRDYLMQPHFITPLVYRAVQDFRMPDDTRDVLLRLEDHLPQALMDPEKVRQVINNLLSNAFKYSEKGSPIEVATVVRKTKEGQWVGFRIKDYGIGMTQEEQGHLFERFYRANPSGKVPGTGLGMALVKEIANQHDGRIELDSIAGKGTAVTVLLPAISAPASTAGES